MGWKQSIEGKNQRQKYLEVEYKISLLTTKVGHFHSILQSVSTINYTVLRLIIPFKMKLF